MVTSENCLGRQGKSALTGETVSRLHATGRSRDASRHENSPRVGFCWRGAFVSCSCAGALWGDFLCTIAHIRSDAFEEDVKVDIDRDVAKKLASRLYDQVGINATVTIRDGKIVSGMALSVIDYDPRPIDEWLRANEGKLGAEAFKGVDIEAFIAEQRA